MDEFGSPVRIEERPGEGSSDPPEDIDHDTRWEPPPAPGSGAGGWGDVPWQPAPNEPTGPARSPLTRRLAVLAIAAMAFASGGVGVALGANLHHRLSSSPAATAIPQPGASAPSGSALPSPGSSLPSTASPSTGSSGLDAAAVAASVSPAIVDINTTLANGQAAGTGMVLTSSGLVLTNNHVIDGATSIQVQIDGTGPTYSATVVGYDVTHDVALLQMQNVSGLKAIPVGDSSKVAVNDPVVAIGNALGRSGPPAVTQGSVSALNQSITANDTTGNSETLNGTIQINAPIQPGDSGGALVNASGQVIGMNTAAAGGYRQYSASNVAFAIPINSALSIARQIQAGQASTTIHIGVRGVLGVQVQPASASNGNQFGGASTTSGAPIVGVASGSPAASAGLVAGDVITSVGSKTITSVTDLQPALDPYHPGDRVNISWVDSAGQHHSATLSLIAGPPA